MYDAVIMKGAVIREPSIFSPFRDCFSCREPPCPKSFLSWESSDTMNSQVGGKAISIGTILLGQFSSKPPHGVAKTVPEQVTWQHCSFIFPPSNPGFVCFFFSFPSTDFDTKSTS